MPEKSLHIILISDHSERTTRIQKALDVENPGAITLAAAGSFSEAVAVYRSGGADVFLLDFALGGLRGLDLLHRAAPSVPVVVIGESDSVEKHRGEAVQAGAAECLPEASLNFELLKRVVVSRAASPVRSDEDAGARSIESATSAAAVAAPDGPEAPSDADESGPHDKKSAFTSVRADELLEEANTIRVLLIEDNPGDVFLIRQALEECRDEKFELETATRLSEGIQLLGEHGVDVVLLDLVLPDSSGLRTFFKVRNAAKGAAIIAVAALDDRELGASILHEGAQDFLLKGKIDSDQLARSIRYSMERNRVEREVEEAREIAVKASRAKSDFLASMSHEIRTPMNSILGMAEILMESNLDNEQRRYLETLNNAGEALMALINDVLDLSKIEADKVELEICNFNLHELVEKTTTLHAAKAEEKGLILVCDIAADVPQYVGGDQTRLRQVLLNLLGNAIKFTEKGEVLLRVDRKGSTPDVVSLRFCVADTGVGVPEDKLQSIFAAFTQADSSVTRKYGGTGLGLAISGRLARLMGGELWCESELGEGSRFFLTTSFKPQESQTTTASLPARVRDMAALVWMENATERGAVRETLSSWAAQVFEVDKEDPAIDELWRAQSSGKPYELVFLEAREGTNRLELAAGIDRDTELASKPIVFLNSAEAGTEARKCEELGIEYLIKPVLQSDLVRVLERVFGDDASDRKAASDPRPRIEGPLPPLRILLVDDSEDNRLLILSFFKTTPFQIASAENGKQALEKLRSRKYDLVLMDMQMPVMDGYTAMREFRKWEEEKDVHRTPVIALTAQAFREHEQKTGEVGCDMYLVKPIKKRKLLEAILEHADTEGLETQEYDPFGRSVEMMPDPPRKGLPPARETTVQRLTEATTGEDDEEDEIRLLVPGYLRNRWQDVTRIENALKESDFATIQRLGHNMKGTGSGYGFESLAEIGRSLEEAAKQSDAALIKTLVKGLETFLGNTQVERPPPESELPGRGKKIVIVDDDADYLSLITIKLKKKGFEVACAMDGQSAVKTVREAQPSVILIDLGLPAGDGFAVIERLKSLAPTAHIPVITVSGRDTEADRGKALEAGSLAYIQKPVDIEQLVAEIARVS